MTLDDWLRALHLLSAFAFAGAIVFFVVLIVAGWRVERPSGALALLRLLVVPNVMVAAGSILVLVFGIWLAISLDAYHPWDGWVIAAIVLWAISGATGQRGGKTYERAKELAQERLASGDDASSPELQALLRDRTALILNTISTVSVLLILIDMIWKPGA
jgi:hypothetical protein